MNTLTSWEIGEQSAHKKLGKFGAACVERIRLDYVRTKINIPEQPRKSEPEGDEE